MNKMEKYDLKQIKLKHFEAANADEKCLKYLIEHNKDTLFHIFLKESDTGE